MTDDDKPDSAARDITRRESQRARREAMARQGERWDILREVNTLLIDRMDAGAIPDVEVGFVWSREMDDALANVLGGRDAATLGMDGVARLKHAVEEMGEVHMAAVERVMAGLAPNEGVCFNRELNEDELSAHSACEYLEKRLRDVPDPVLLDDHLVDVLLATLTHWMCNLFDDSPGYVLLDKMTLRAQLDGVCLDHPEQAVDWADTAMVEKYGAPFCPRCDEDERVAAAHLRKGTK